MMTRPRLRLLLLRGLVRTSRISKQEIVGETFGGFIRLAPSSARSIGFRSTECACCEAGSPGVLIATGRDSSKRWHERATNGDAHRRTADAPAPRMCQGRAEGKPS